MIDPQIFALVERLGTAGIFILMYWRERKRVAEVQDARIEDLHRWIQVSSILAERPTPSRDDTP